MITVELEAGREAVCTENPFGNALGGWPPLYHQWLTHQASQTASLVINTFPTGVGKTAAALLPLLDRHRCDNCLLIAPTNELLAQHERDARTFCDRAGLDHLVYRITAEAIDNLKQLPGIAAYRRADRFYQFLQDPRAALGLDQRRPLLLVTNPDLLYLALYFRFNKQDRRNLFRAFAKFKYLVVDEFHYYSAKQFANFLFFLGFLRSYGYFDDGQQVCLLSATPHPKLREYLDRLRIPTIDVAPDQPAVGLPTIPTLAPVQLRLYSTSDLAGLEELIGGAELTAIAGRLAGGEQGAVISSALWRINQLHATLRQAGLGDRLARMTGAETTAARQAARSADLLLATPTVDVGYNFERLEKARQSIDFLYFDARFADELVQRIGRAGRVLGKAVADVPSHVVGAVPDEIYEALKPFDGKRVPRAELTAAIRGLPHRHNLFAYLRSGAIGEAFLPIYHLYQMTEPGEQQDVRHLFEDIRELFAGDSRLTFDRLLIKTRSFAKLEESLEKIEGTDDKSVARLAAQWVDQSAREHHQPLSAEDRAAFVAEAKRPGTPHFESARDWLDGQLRRYHALKAAYHFRDAFSGPEALIFDPDHLLASSDVTRYDVFHVATNYRARFFASRRVWMSECRQSAVDDAEFYCALQARLAPDERLRLELRLIVGDDLHAWENEFVGRLCALHGLTLETPNGRLPRELLDGWKNQYVVALVLPEETRPAGQLKALARDSGTRIMALTVSSDVSTRQRRYCCALGTSALPAEAELRRSIQLWQRREGTGGPAIVV